MRTVILILIATLFIPQSFADENQTLVASINSGSSNLNTQKNKNGETSPFSKYNLLELDLDMMYENTYDFVKSKYSYYSDLELFNRDISGVDRLKDSVTFVGGILPFVSLPENDGREGSSISDDGVSFFFYYKRHF